MNLCEYIVGIGNFNVKIKVVFANNGVDKDSKFFVFYYNDYIYMFAFVYLAIKKCTKWQLNMHATCHFKLLMQ
ncbi:hypothetical protein BpOF4_20719 (plasmid) [Alkalihalophilus pseudofirmus OF4]|uniref:Uncharacterized protein n=1 Tax=Alkalihalophilus pseudofirmus (strain ATCC BAA-2126 / JCM 17055 / OF4) TaxID=398511 RepID=D3G1B3_ALKPO|nr:hypothetical protein BpOF4_20719 [Alkalihalophilus pseudofirmus OF4]